MGRIEPVDTAAAGTLQQICLLEMLMRLLVLPASGVASFFYSVTWTLAFSWKMSKLLFLTAMIALKTNDRSTIIQSGRLLGNVIPYRPMESCVELPWAAEPLSKVAPERKSLAFNRPLKYLSKDNLHHCGGSRPRRPNFEPILWYSSLSIQRWITTGTALHHCMSD